MVFDPNSAMIGYNLVKGAGDQAREGIREWGKSHEQRYRKQLLDEQIARQKALADKEEKKAAREEKLYESIDSMMASGKEPAMSDLYRLALLRGDTAGAARIVEAQARMGIAEGRFGLAKDRAASGGGRSGSVGKKPGGKGKSYRPGGREVSLYEVSPPAPEGGDAASPERNPVALMEALPPSRMAIPTPNLAEDVEVPVLGQRHPYTGDILTPAPRPNPMRNVAVDRPVVNPATGQTITPRPTVSAAPESSADALFVNRRTGQPLSPEGLSNLFDGNQDPETGVVYPGLLDRLKAAKEGGLPLENALIDAFAYERGARIAPGVRIAYDPKTDFVSIVAPDGRIARINSADLMGTPPPEKLGVIKDAGVRGIPVDPSGKIGAVQFYPERAAGDPNAAAKAQFAAEDEVLNDARAAIRFAGDWTNEAGPGQAAGFLKSLRQNVERNLGKRLGVVPPGAVDRVMRAVEAEVGADLKRAAGVTDEVQLQPEQPAADDYLTPEQPAAAPAAPPKPKAGGFTGERFRRF